MKSKSVIMEKLNNEIKKPLPHDDSFEYGKCRGWIDALQWVLDI